MKTAVGILNEKDVIGFDEVDWLSIQETMKAYAEQAINECAEEAEIRNYRIDKQSILNVKNLLK
jgi:hypothetical protein